MPVDKFGRHLFHHRRLSPRDFYYNVVLSLLLKSSDSTFSEDVTTLGYTYTVGNTNMYHFPLTVVVKEIRKPFAIIVYNLDRRKLFTADSIIGETLKKGETLLFLSKEQDSKDRLIEIVLECPIILKND